MEKPGWITASMVTDVYYELLNASLKKEEEGSVWEKDDQIHYRLALVDMVNGITEKLKED